MNHFSVETVRDALRHCYDPELPCNIVDLGLVSEIVVRLAKGAPGAGIAGVPPRFDVRVVLTPATRGEAAESQLQAQVSNRLAGIEAIRSSEVLVAHNPPWHPGHITQAGRRTLGLDGNRNLVQIR